MNNIKDIISWYEEFDNSNIVIKSENHSFDLNILTVNLPHLLGLHYATYQRMRGKSLLNYIEKLDDDKIYNNIIKYNEDKLSLVKDRIKYFKYFMENLDKTLLVEQTHPTSKIKSEFLLVEDESGKILQLGIARDREDTDYFETFLVREDNTYFKESTILEKVISIEKWEQDKLVPFSFKKQEISQEHSNAISDEVVTLEDIKTIRIEVVGEQFYGLNAVKVGKTNTFKEMDSLRIFSNNRFHRFSNGEHGDVINFVKMMSDCDFKTAIAMLKEFYETNTITKEDYDRINVKYQQPDINAKTQMELPVKNEHNKNVFAYLTKTRCIKPEIVNDYIKKKLLYQDAKNNCVFVGYVDGVPTCANVRSTYSDFKGVVANSFDDVGFYVHYPEQKNDTLVLCEGSIDIMSYQSLLEDYKSMDFLSSQGVDKARNSLYYRSQKEEHFLNQYKKIIIAFDNDPINETLGYSVGRRAAEQLKEWIKDELPHIQVQVHFPKLKDFNDDLVEKVKTMTVDNMKKVMMK